MAAADSERISELFSAFRPVTVRRMFGGAGLYADGLMFGILDDDRIYLKADASSEDRFRNAGSQQFTYLKNGRATAMSYWQLPMELYDDPEELARWAATALAVAQRAALSKGLRKHRSN